MTYTNLVMFLLLHLTLKQLLLSVFVLLLSGPNSWVGETRHGVGQMAPADENLFGTALK